MINTGDSLIVLQQLAEDVGVEVVSQVALLAESAVTQREDSLFLTELPLFE